MPKFDYDEMLNDVVELILDTGRKVQLLNYTSGADPVRPWKGDAAGPVVKETFDTTGTFVPAWGNEFGGSWVSEDLLAQVSDCCLIAGTPDGRDLREFTHINDNGQVLKVEWGQVLHPGPLTLLYIFGLKR